jgi:Do/DeqQ family serine protease
MIAKYAQAISLSFILSVSIIQPHEAKASLPTHDSSGQQLPSLAPMLKDVNPAVVNIATLSKQRANNPLLNDPFFRRFFNIPDGQQQRPTLPKQSAGSGVIVDAKNGYVVTNYHVIKDADEIRVSLNNGKHYTATKLGVDPELDIAVLKIDADDLTSIKLADSSKVEVGDFAVAIGNPFALGQTVTTGIVSALGRTGLGIEGFENFIQTDASINPGNSGGALVNLRGELIGINTAIISPAGGNVGIGFSIPTNMVKNSLEQIIATGEVKRGMIGVGIQDVTPELQEVFGLENGQQGVLITNVIDDSPADDAGIKVDDIIIGVNGEKTLSGNQLRSQISKYPINKKVEIKLIRNGKVKTLKVKIGEQKSGALSNRQMHELLEGVEFELSQEIEGIAVKSVAQNALAGFKGLRAGDVIVGVNRTRVKTLSEFADALDKNDERVLMRVVRGRSSFYIVLP